ncbi:MAG: DUF3341 domain-containing protein [Opitutaceae bacterium]
MATDSYGMMAAFDTTADLIKAAAKVRDAGFQHWDVITPFPIHGMDGAMGLKRSRVPRFSLAGGITGFTTGMLMVAYMNWFDYPLIVGGKPLFSPIFAFPVSYELTILFASFGSIIGMFLLNRLPMHYHPVMNRDRVRQASDDRFFIVIESCDPHYRKESVRSLLDQVGGKDIEELED